MDKFLEYRTQGRGKFFIMATLFLLFLAALTLNGCLEKETEVKYSHKGHKEYTPTCSECHASTSEGEISRAGHEQCLKCHKINESTLSEECLYCHRTKKPLSKPLKRPDYSPAPPYHEVHARNNVGCDKCHGDITNEKRVVGIDFIRMEGCIQCHFPNKDKEDLTFECEVCHFEFDKKSVPSSHKSNFWQITHGKQVQAKPELCSRCHKQHDCDQCHRVVRPENHTNIFRKRGHGLHAVSDPGRCQTCHRQDMCLNCHLTVEPRYHTTSFKTKRPYTHCGMCHLPLAEGNRCRACHFEVNHFRARADAPAPPAFVDRSLPCFTCHPVELVPIKHLYNTIPDTQCILCH